MPSPFPGRNPYLEQERIWAGFHQRFVIAAADSINPQVSPDDIIQVEENIWVHEPEGDTRALLGRADAALLPTGEVTSPGAATAIIPATGLLLLPQQQTERASYLEIRDRESQALVTVVEMLSPSNKKAGKDRDQYLGKRGLVLSSSAHFVELDLLRTCGRMPGETWPPCDYGVLVSRAEVRPRAAYWAIQLRDPLPVIPIPLRAPAPDAHLDLQQVLHRVYDAAYYKDYLYAGRPQPALSPEDDAWARQFVPQSG